jgi:citrate lyase gamma subunit
MASSWSDATRYLIDGKELEKSLDEEVKVFFGEEIEELLNSEVAAQDIEAFWEKVKEKIIDQAKNQSGSVRSKLDEAVKDQICHIYSYELAKREAGQLRRVIDVAISLMSSDDPWLDLKTLVTILLDEIKKGVGEDVRRQLILTALEEYGINWHQLNPSQQRQIDDLVADRR